MLEALIKDPFKRVVLSSAGQMVWKERHQEITAAANLPKWLQNVDFLGEFRKQLNIVMQESVQSSSLKANEAKSLQGKKRYMTHGAMFNDALAGAMAAARHLEKQGHASENAVLLDVGTGLANSNVDGTVITTSESQNAKLRDGLTIEDVTSLRGMREQAVRLLIEMVPSGRKKNPVYQQMAQKYQQTVGKIVISIDCLRQGRQRMFKKSFKKNNYSIPPIYYPIFRTAV